MTQHFKEQHPELQHIVRELLWVREHNFKCVEAGRRNQLLFFAEGALVLIALERFVRIVVGSEATDSDTLYNLLQRAVSKELLILPWDDQNDGIGKIKAVRNSLLHGNYEQAAKLAGCESVVDFFGSSQFISEIECLFHVVVDLMRQIDISTGKPTGVAPLQVPR